MAAVNRVKARPCTPVGYEVVDKVQLDGDVVAGDLLTYTGDVSEGQSVMEKAPAGTVEAHGIALQDGYEGQRGFSVGIQGEMDGFSGLTPGDPLFPSDAVAGGLDDSAPEFYGAATDPAVSVPASARIRAVTASRIRYNFV